MSELYNRIMEKAAEKGLSAYALCQRAGVPINTAKYLMGHTNIAVTSQIYTHSGVEDVLLAGSMIDQAAAKINNTPSPVTVLPGKPESRSEPEPKSETTAS